MMVMRYQLAYPETVIPIVGWLFAESGGVMLPENYNTLGAMHGTIMIFLGVVPLAVGAFGNYLVPLQVGAPDMAFPRLNATSYWTYAIGGVIMMASFLLLKVLLEAVGPLILHYQFLNRVRPCGYSP